MNIEDKRIENILNNPLKEIPSLEESIEISTKFNLPLHPRYLLYWNELSVSELIKFLESLKEIKIESDMKSSIYNSKDIKNILEKLAIEHTVEKTPLDKIKSEKESEKIIIQANYTKILMINLGLEIKNITKDNLIFSIDEINEIAIKNLSSNPCEVISKFSKIEIRDKGGSYIGARMGRPEKAKMRKLDGRPHGLFPVGEEGGRLKNLMEAFERKGKVTSEFAIFYDKENNKESIYPVNPKGDKNEELYFERYTGTQVRKPKEESVRYKRTSIDLTEYVKDARKIIGPTELPKIIKGIKGTSNKHHVVEHLSKSFLRALNNVYVNKDGTIRFDMIEMGVTHFKPSEIGVNVEKIRELGYEKDYLGNDITNENQIIEMMPQDVILPDCIESGDELASNFVINTGNFVDDLLEKLYGIERFYNFKTKEDTIGHLIVGLAPHTSAGIVGRILGYSKTQGCFSHPVWHAAQRRNLDGDENGIILLLDALINFSREYLPDRRGAKTMDTSLVLTSHLYLDQIDDEVHGMDIEFGYDLDLYKAAKEYKSPKEVKVKKLGDVIFNEDVDSRYFGYGFTHPTDDMNDTNLCSSYKSIPLMIDKMHMQLDLGKKIRAVDEDQVGSFIIDKHFMKDIKGNLRKFSMQSFRCTKCNEIYRRPPLIGKCIKCGNPSINFTISEGSIKKYLNPSFDIISEFKVDPYIVETLELANLRIQGVFGKEKDKQKSLQDYWS